MALVLEIDPKSLISLCLWISTNDKTAGTTRPWSTSSCWAGARSRSTSRTVTARRLSTQRPGGVPVTWQSLEVHLPVFRFNVPEAARALLRREDVDVNAKSKLGSSPAMVAVKYASCDALKVRGNFSIFRQKNLMKITGTTFSRELFRFLSAMRELTWRRWTTV